MRMGRYEPGKGIGTTTYERAREIARSCADAWGRPASIVIVKPAPRYRVVQGYDVAPGDTVVNQIGPGCPA